MRLLTDHLAVIRIKFYSHWMLFFLSEFSDLNDEFIDEIRRENAPTGAFFYSASGLSAVLPQCPQ